MLIYGMDLYRLRALLAAPLASLLLVLVICGFVIQRPVSAGIHMPMTKVEVIPAEDCFRGLRDRDIVLRIKNDGTTWINETIESRGIIRETLSKIYENRDEKIAYFLVDPDVPYGEFADFYDQAASSTPDLHIGLLTRGLRNQVEQCPSGSGCTIEWPIEPSNNYCWNMLPPVRVPRYRVR